MKKTMIIAFAMLLSLGACKKDDSSTSTNATRSPITFKQKTLKVDHFYQDMTLLPRNPGENFDTYAAGWYGLNVRVYGPLSWNNQKYPTLVNGVPLVGASITADGSSNILSQNTGPDGNVFAISQSELGSSGFSSFQTGLDQYYNSLDTWFGLGSIGAPPIISSYVADSYGTDGTIFTATGKLIRVTTGSGVAIASTDYPLPTAITPPIVDLNLDMPDPDAVNHPNVVYSLHGSGGVFKTATEYINGVNKNLTISASYAYVALAPGSFHYWGTIIRLDGTSFSFNITRDFS